MQCPTHVLRVREIIGLLIILYSLGETKRKETPRPKIDVLDMSDFAAVIHRASFVDKSMFIKEFFEGTPRILITAPHEFGKSAIMDMVRRFMSYPNVTDELLDGDLTYDCRMFRYFNLSISRDTNFFNEHCGQYPVIYLDFVDLLVHDHADMLNSFKYAIYVAFRHHDYMVKSVGVDKWAWTNDRMKEHDVEKFLTYWLESRMGPISEFDLKKSLFYLSHVLHAYHDKKVTVLIDEFDSIWQKSVSQVDSKVKMASEFLKRLMFVLFASNPHIHRVLLASCMKYGSLVTLGKVKSIRLFEFGEDHRYAKYFGLTSDEVQGLLHKFNSSDDLRTVRLWYNGYKVPNQNLTLYNTWSVTHYVHSGGILKSYWTGFKYIHNIRRVSMLSTIREYLMKLAHEAPVPVRPFQRPYNYYPLYNIKTVLGHPKQIWRMPEHWNDFLVYLYECRFVKRATAGDNSTSQLMVVLPNNEAVQMLYVCMYSRPYYEKHFKFKSTRMYEFLDCFNALGKYDNISAMFTYFAYTVASLYTFTRLPEDTYAFGFSFYYMFKLTRVYPVFHYEVSSTVSHRRRSMYVTVIRDDGTAIIMETSYGCRESAEASLRRIIDTGYYKILDHRPDFRDRVTGSRIYIGMFMDEMKLAEVCYLVNSTEIKHRSCCTSALNLGIPVYVVAQIKSFMNRYIASTSNNRTVFIRRELAHMYVSNATYRNATIANTSVVL